MASKLLRRSGVAVGLVLDQLQWIPDLVVQGGIGFFHEECDVLHQEWPNTKFIGFEAHPDIASKVKDYPGQLISKAVGNRCGRALLNSKSKHKDGSSFYEFKEDIDSIKEIEIDVITLDSIINHEEVDNVLLWLDCEGSELNALFGASYLLQKVKAVNIEMTANPPSLYWPSTIEVHNYLKDLGFFRQWIHTLRGGQYDAIYVRKEIFKPEYCCCPYTIVEFQNKNGRKALL